MATIVKRGTTYSVVYSHDGRQHWEPFKTKSAALIRKREVEYLKDKHKFVPPSPKTVQDFLGEYVAVYGSTKWGHSTYASNMSLINNYVLPAIGDWKLKELTVSKMDSFFSDLSKTKAVQQKGRAAAGMVSSRVIYEVNLLLSNAFDRAVEWEYVGKNPITRNACPDREDNTREIWNPDVAKAALAACKNLDLLVCMHLAISCSLRIGEITGLRWSNVSFGSGPPFFEDAKVKIELQLQRISRAAYDKIPRKQERVKLVFPECKREPKTMLVLKTLKTKSSERVVWMPKTTATLLYRLKQEQQELKNVLGDEYIDFDMVIAHTSGRPVESGQVNELFKQLIEERGYPEVTFHSLRHLSTTVKLLINQGDVKAVQGDTGHAQSKMVTDTYAHILDSNRRTGAEKFDREFFTPSETQTTEAAGNSAELSVEQLLAQCLKNPEAISLLKSIFNTVP